MCPEIVRAAKTRHDVIHSLVSQNTYFETFYSGKHIHVRNTVLSGGDIIPALMQLIFLHATNRHAQITYANYTL